MVERLKESFFKNWRTTTAAIVMAILAGLPHLVPILPTSFDTHTISELIIAIGTAFGLILAKDGSNK